MYGTSSEIPKNPMTPTENNRNVCAGIPNKLTIEVKNNVKKVKLLTNPIMTPIGLCLPICLDPTTEERMIGKTGKIHGDNTVTIPDKNEKISNNTMTIEYFESNFQFYHHSIYLPLYHSHQFARMYVDR